MLSPFFLHCRHDRFIVYQFKTVSLFSNRDSKVAKRIPSLSSSSYRVKSPSSTTGLNSAERSNLKSLPLLLLTAATQHHTKMMYYWLIHHLRTFSIEKNHQNDGSVSANFVGNTLTRSEAIEIYTPYDVTSSSPWKTKIAFFANFRGIEKLFCVPDQSLNSKIMNQCWLLWATVEPFVESSNDARWQKNSN